MKKTTPFRVFLSIYMGVLVAGLIALAIDAAHHIHFHWTHGYAIHGYENFMFWFQTGLVYGIYGLPFVLVASYVIAWLVNLFAKGAK